MVVVVTPSPCVDVDVVVVDELVVVVLGWQTEMLTVPPLATWEPARRILTVDVARLGVVGAGQCRMWCSHVRPALVIWFCAELASARRRPGTDDTVGDHQVDRAVGLRIGTTARGSARRRSRSDTLAGQPCEVDPMFRPALRQGCARRGGALPEHGRNRDSGLVGHRQRDRDVRLDGRAAAGS